VPAPEESDEDDIPMDSSEEEIDDLEDPRDREQVEYTEVLLDGEENIMLKMGKRYRRVKVQKGEEYVPTEEEIKKLKADPQFQATSKRMTQQFQVIMANSVSAHPTARQCRHVDANYLDPQQQDQRSTNR
jgi:ATP-dependent 26S proteasome regulatory subunit